MSAFTLEIVRRGETPAVADVVTLPDGRLIWRQVEALALLIESPEGAFIRVKNEKAETIIRAGVRTTLASIHSLSVHGLSAQESARETHRSGNGSWGRRLIFRQDDSLPLRGGSREGVRFVRRRGR